MVQRLPPFHPSWRALLAYEERERCDPFRPVVVVPLWTPDDIAELRALVAEKAEERRLAGVGLAPDQIEQRRFARRLDRQFRSHGAVARSARQPLSHSASPPADATLTGRARSLAAREGSPSSQPPPSVEQSSLLGLTGIGG